MTSGIITTLGLVVGLHSGTHSKLAVIGGILTIAVADAFSDAMGIHMSEEAEARHTAREVWESTLSTFLFKFVFAASFIAPVLLFPLPLAVTLAVVWGLLILGFFSYTLAREQGKRPLLVVGEHLIIAVAVVGASYLIGNWVALTFG